MDKIRYKSDPMRSKLPVIHNKSTDDIETGSIGSNRSFKNHAFDNKNSKFDTSYSSIVDPNKTLYQNQIFDTRANSIKKPDLSQLIDYDPHKMQLNQSTDQMQTNKPIKMFNKQLK